MIAVDTNLLIYSHREENEFHAAARAAIDQLRHGHTNWAIPWPCVHEFIGIVTHPKIYQPPTPLSVALATVEAWQAAENLLLIGESEGYLTKLKDLAMAAHLKGARIHDARIAAICLHHGINELWSADRDFSSFPQIKVKNPLVKR